jgi:aminoglycoside phosphotransferase (APT) family kinase protein
MLADVDGKKFNFRISFREHKNSRTEFLNLKRLPPGFGPKPIYFDSSKQILPREYMILEYIEGKSLKRWSDKHIKMHAKALARLHSIKKPLKKGIDILDWFDDHAGYFEERMQIYKDKDIAEILPKVRQHVKQNRQLFLNLKKASLIHADACMANIIFNKGHVRYVDFEWSHYFDNAYDFVFIYDEFAAQPPWKMKLKGKRLDMYFRTYNRYMKDKTLRKRAAVWSKVYRLTDLLYFKYKLHNWKNEKSKDIPKSTYQKYLNTTIKILRNELK